MCSILASSQVPEPWNVRHEKLGPMCLWPEAFLWMVHHEEERECLKIVIGKITSLMLSLETYHQVTHGIWNLLSLDFKTCNDNYSTASLTKSMSLMTSRPSWSHFTSSSCEKKLLM
jgi:hypothetical protein